MRLFDKKWYTLVSPPIEPTAELTQTLERLRQNFGIKHDVFAKLIMSSGGFLFANLFSIACGFESEYKILNDRQVLAAAYTLWNAIRVNGARYNLTMERLLQIRRDCEGDIVYALRNADSALASLKIKDIGDLANHFLELEGTYREATPEQRGIYMLIDSVFADAWKDR